MKDKYYVCRMPWFFRLFLGVAAGFLMINMYGCTFSGSRSVSRNREENLNMGEESALDIFAVSGNSQPAQTKSPKVLIGLNGYGADDKKTAFFLGGKEGGAFFVVDAITRETVYRGEMIASDYRSEKGELLLKGDFTEVSEEGTYYIEAPSIGRSYTFGIDGDYLEILRGNLLEALRNEAGRTDGVYLYRVQTLCWILRYEEFYGKQKAVGVPAELPEMLKCAKELGDRLIEQKEESLGVEEEAFYCSAMAGLYKALKPYDERAARDYLREAETVYRQLERRQYEEGFDEVWIFYDASVLYNATGSGVYHNVLKNYLKDDLKDAQERSLFAAGGKEEQILRDEAYIYGVVAYLTNTYGGDVDLCNGLMEDLLEETRSIGAEYNENPYLCVSSDLRNRVLSDRLYMLAVAEYAILSKEYVQMMKEGIHYIDGCNETGMSLLSKSGIRDEGRDTNDSDAAIGGAYLFVLGEIMERESME